MREPPHYSALIVGQTAAIEMINSGVAGLPVLDQILLSTWAAVRATGVAFVEYGRTGGRVVGAAGDARWAIGRPVPIADPTAAHMLSGPRV
ncbi:MAG TPA: PAS domain-containing sensor histidine kinase, partial [Micromonospora sp.]